MNNHQNAIFHQLDNFIKHSHSFAMTIFHTINNSAKLVTLLIIPTYAKVSIYIRTQGSGRGYWGGVNNFLKDNVWSPIDQKVINKFR
ncbi:hypothetical protein BSPLISOX_2315 [uncultured Gammaproteobacteria bacterium]|jgi:hypothetical protein|nr:hypothetical protein BSPLISOX_2315 [uncultured Gammaproteobacteria bacterium]